MADETKKDIDRASVHYKGKFANIYEVNKKYPNGGTDGDYVEIDGWAHYWNADRGTWTVNAERDSYWDEVITALGTDISNLQTAIKAQTGDAKTGSCLIVDDFASSDAIAKLSGTERAKAIATNCRTWLDECSFLSGEANAETMKRLGRCRLGFDGTNFECYNFVLSETENKGVQMVMGAVDYSSTYDTIVSSDDFNILWRYRSADGWGRWHYYRNKIVTITEEDYEALVAAGKADEETYYNVIE